jgi:hypothetical protein
MAKLYDGHNEVFSPIHTCIAERITLKIIAYMYVGKMVAVSSEHWYGALGQQRISELAEAWLEAWSCECT